MVIGERIKRERLKLGLSQQQLGDLLGVSKVSVCGYETGTRTPSLETFLDLLKLLNLTPDYLLGRDVMVVAEAEEPYQLVMPKEDIEILQTLKQYPDLYQKLTTDSKRTVELLDRTLKKY